MPTTVFSISCSNCKAFLRCLLTSRRKRCTIVCQKKNGHLPIFLIVQATFSCFAIVATMLLTHRAILRASRRPSLTIKLYWITEHAAITNAAVRQATHRGPDPRLAISPWDDGAVRPGRRPSDCRDPAP